MTVIAEKDREKIRELLARELDHPVELLLFTRPRSRLFVPGRPDCETCAETEELLGELAELGGDKLALTMQNVAADPAVSRALGVAEVPTVVVRRAPAPDAAPPGAASGADRPPAGRAPGRGDAAGEASELPGDAAGEASGVPGGAARRAAGGPDLPDEPPANVRFVGMPSGYEFSTLVADVVDVSKGRTDLSEATRAAVRAIASPVRIEVFVTPT